MQVRPTPKTGTEKESLLAFLNNYRAAMAWKLQGLSVEDARRRLVPSGTNLLSLVHHLAWTEAYWFREVFLGEEVDYPFPDEDPDADFEVPEGTTVEDVVSLYERQAADTTAIVERSGLEDVSKGDQRGNRFSLRWILLHMLEETARHAGHADIVRELLDGATGHMPPS